MPLEVSIKPVESLLFRGEVVAIGKFRCPATDALFRDSGPCSHHTFVFPRTITGIRHEDGASFVATPGSVALYNQHQLYTRAKISDVDASDWYTVADDVLMEMVTEHDQGATMRRPFRIAERPSDRRAFIEQRLLFDALDRGRELDPAHVEETVLRILSTVLAGAYQSEPKRMRQRRAGIEAVEQARHLIASAPARNMPLRELASACGVSPFQLCRLFRARTGSTISSYRHSLRARLALDLLRDDRRDLTAVALDLGYSSHSHFTAVFRRQTGMTPAQFRGR